MSDGVIVGRIDENGTGYGYGGQIKSNSGYTVEFLYVQAYTEKGEVLMKSFDGDEEYNPSAITCATSTVAITKVVATKDQGSIAGFQWCVTKGYCEMLVDGTADVAKDDYLEVKPNADGATDDGTSRTAESFAMACEAQTTNADTLTDVYVFGVDTLTTA